MRLTQRQRRAVAMLDAKLIRLVDQIPVDQMVQIVSDLKTVGIVHAAGGNYKAFARQIANKYLGRRRKLLDGIINHIYFERLLDQFITDYLAAHQPSQDASVAAEET